MLLRLTDKTGDWLQEDRGVSLPRIQLATLMTMVTFIVIGLLQDIVNREWWDFALISTLWLVLAPALHSERKKYIRDAEDWNEKRFPPYRVIALVYREHIVTRITRWVTVSVSVTVTLGGLLYVWHDVWNLDYAFFFYCWSFSAYLYSKCIFPKMPKKREERQGFRDLALQGAS